MNKKFNYVYAILWFVIFILSDNSVFACPPSNPNSNENVRKILNWMRTLPGKDKDRVIIGQHLQSIIHIKRGWKDEIEPVYRETRKYPGLITFELQHGDHPHTKFLEGIPVLEKHWQAGGLIAASYHMRNPWNNGKTKDTSRLASLEDLIDPSKDVYAVWMGELDMIADFFEELQKKDMVIIWRPLHEVNMTWSWWGAAAKNDPEAFKAVWRHMYTYFTTTRRLNNIIWNYSPSGHRDNLVAYYPGDDYVDIVGPDMYGKGTLNRTGHFSKQYDAMIKLGKIAGVSEHGFKEGNNPLHQTLDEMQTDYPDLIFLSMWGRNYSIKSSADPSATMDHPLAITRDELSWKAAPAKTQATPCPKNQPGSSAGIVAKPEP